MNRLAEHAAPVSRPRGPAFRARSLFDAFLAVCGTAVCALTVMGFLGKWSWRCDLAAHFRPQYFLALTIIAILLAVCRKFRLAATGGVFAAVNLLFVAPLYVGGDSSKPTGGTLRLLLSNVHTSNDQYDRVKNMVREHAPDLIVLEEVNFTWMDNLAELESSYPHKKSSPREDNFGIALFSKLPLENAEIVYLGDAGVPSVVARLKLDRKQVTVVGTHCIPPVTESGFRFRNDQMRAVAEFAAKRNGPTIVLGDLNATPWSHYFRQLLRDSGLRDSGRGYGVQCTWPTAMWPGPAVSLLLRLPIDHCLVSPDLRVVRRAVGGDIGSDHLPLIVEVGLVE